MAVLSATERGVLEHMINRLHKGKGWLTDPVGTAAMVQVARDICGVLGYEVVWSVAGHRYRLLPKDDRVPNPSHAVR